MPDLRPLSIGTPVAPDEMAAVVDREQLERGFWRLSVEQRAVVVLHHYRGLPLTRSASP
jgi:hypothetical protein